MDGATDYGSNRGGAAANPNKKLQQTQAQVDEVISIMTENVEKVLARDEKLSDLDFRAGQCMNYAFGKVVGIMRNNVAKVLERDEKLSELDQRADNLRNGASQFEQQAARLKRKYWWQNLKMMIIIGIIVAVILIIIIVSISSSFSSDTPAPAPQPTPSVAPAPSSSSG